MLERLSGTRPLLGEVLLRKGIVTKEQLDEALARQKETGQLLGEALVSLGYVSEWDIYEALKEQDKPYLSKLTAIEHDTLLKEVQSRMLSRIGQEKDIRQALTNVCRDVLAHKRPDIVHAYLEFAVDAYNRLYSLGPLEKHLAPDSSAVNIISFGTTITVERIDGTKEVDPQGFVSDEEVRRVFDRIASLAKRELSVRDPSLDGELPDGSRVLLVIPPEAEKPYASIRRNVKRTARLKDLVKGLDGLDKMVFYLKNAVLARKNFVIAGSTNAGKTTLMNALLHEVQPLHTIAILEDTREIYLDHRFVGYFKTRETPGAPPITWQRILKDCLRFSPQRIVLTEIRTPAAAYEFIQVLNTGHQGSFSSIHANSAPDALFRLETLIQEHRNLPVEVIRKLLARVVDVVVFVATVEDEQGATVGRRLVEIVEVDNELKDGMYNFREVLPG